MAAQARVTNLIAMFGNRVSGIDEPAAIANCIGAASRPHLSPKNTASRSAWNCSAAKWIMPNVGVVMLRSAVSGHARRQFAAK